MVFSVAEIVTSLILKNPISMNAYEHAMKMWLRNQLRFWSHSEFNIDEDL